MARAKNAIDAYIDRHFIVNEFGIWCPNCQEMIDYFWPESCDHCGYPKPDHERYDRDHDDWGDNGR